MRVRASTFPRALHPERDHRLRRQVRAFGSSRRPSTGVRFPTSLLRLYVRRAIESNSFTQAPLGTHHSPYPVSLHVASKTPLFLSSPSESEPRPVVTRIVTPVTRRSFPLLPLLTRHRHPHSPARASPRTDQTADSAGAHTTPLSRRSQFGLFVGRAAAPHLPASVHGERKGARGGLNELYTHGRNVLQHSYSR